MVKAFIKSLFYLRSISKSLQRLVLLYEADLRERNIIIPDPKAPNPEVEVLYGTPPPASDQPWN